MACYVPPNYAALRGREALSFAAGAVAEAKRKLDDPLVIGVGGFNQWGIQDSLTDFPDLVDHAVGNTRGGILH